jgi:CobQ-like glutamine amidotransferase family enzyme
MKIEVLYPEVCCLYGDLMNIEYLHQCLPEAEIIRTSLKSEPAFTAGGVDMLYLCSASERGQELVIGALRPYRDKLQAYIDSGAVLLATGNALEIFLHDIENEDGTTVEALGFFDLTAKRQMKKRYNSPYLGKFGDIDIVGYKCQFSHAYEDGGEEVPGLFETVRGAGWNPGSVPEGIRRNNFMATYVLGPLLVLNPPFTKYLLELLGEKDKPLTFEKAALAAYDRRLKEFSDPKRDFNMY